MIKYLQFGLGFGCLSLSGTTIYNWGGLPPIAIAVAVGVILPLCVAAVAFGSAIAKNQTFGRVFLLCIFGAALGTFAGEYYLNEKFTVQETENKLSRTKIKKNIQKEINALVREGITAYPIVVPATWLPNLTKTNSADRPRELLPLSALSNVRTITCDEGGGLVHYDSDEFGFRNPRGIWRQQPIQIALVGDSYLHGACVHSPHLIADVIRAQFPATLNFGMGGNGPLLELATVREFGTVTRPQHVVWLFTIENDFFELTKENKILGLNAYFDHGYSQNLMSRQEEVDSIVKQRIQPVSAKKISTTKRIAGRQKIETSKESTDIGRSKASFVWRCFLTLCRVRTTTGVIFSKPKRNYDLFRAVLKSAQESITTWGGRLWFVYVPSSSELMGLSRFDLTSELIRKELFKSVRSLGISVIDGLDILEEKSNGRSLHYYWSSHFNPLGQRLLGEGIVEALVAGNGKKAK